MSPSVALQIMYLFSKGEKKTMWILKAKEYILTEWNEGKVTAIVSKSSTFVLSFQVTFPLLQYIKWRITRTEPQIKTFVELLPFQLHSHKGLSALATVCSMRSPFTTDNRPTKETVHGGSNVAAVICHLDLKSAKWVAGWLDLFIRMLRHQVGLDIRKTCLLWIKCQVSNSVQ